MLKRQPAAVITGLIFILVGGGLIVSAIGLPVPSVSALWPGILLLVAVGMLWQYASESRHRDGLLFIGVVLSGFSLLALAFSVGLEGLTWFDFRRFWPMLLVLVGLGLLMAYMAGDFTRHSLRIPAALIGGLGLLLLPVTLGLHRTESFRQILTYWPVLLVPVLLTFFFRLRSHDAEEA